MRHDPASGAVIIMLRSLKMYGMAQAVTDLIEQGAPAFEASVPILTQLLKAETAEREVRSIAYHMKMARFPAYKDLSGFDFSNSEMNEATVRQLHPGEFMDGAQNVVLIGGPGTGKTHVATALGVQAIEHHRRKVRCFSTIELVNALEQEKAKGKAGQIVETLVRLDLVILDELGYLPFSASGGALLFHLLSKLYERTSVVITTNLSFSEWAIAGVPAEQVKDRMIELDARRNELERRLSASPAPDPIRTHPGMAKAYRARIGQLIAGLSDAERMDEAKEVLRALIEKVELVPVSAEESEISKSGGSSKPGLAIHLHGALASLLRLACGLPVHEVVGAATQTQKAPQNAGRGVAINGQSDDADLQFIDNIGELVLVAGASYHRSLPELRCAV